MEKSRQTALEMAKEEDAQTKETAPAEEGLDTRSLSVGVWGNLGSSRAPVTITNILDRCRMRDEGKRVC